MNRSAIRTPWWRAAIAVSALAPVVGLLCPPAHARSDAIIWEGDDQSVVLAPQDEETAPPNDHPATLAPQDIERMLASLRFRYADQVTDTPPVAVFNAEQVEILGEALATGLSRATPSQDVTFSIIGSHRMSPGAFARRNRLTAGRVFFREGELNVIFGEIQSPYRKKNIYGQVDQDFYPREFGSRTIPSEQESILIASTAASLRGDAEGKRDDWVVFDPDAASLPLDAAPASVDTSGAAETDDIEQRLETLKRLRDEGLVSEEAYREKVDEILEEL